MSPSEVDVRWRDIDQALVVALMIVVIYEGFYLTLQIPWQRLLQGLVPTFNLALGLGMIWRASTVFHTPVAQPFSQVAGNIAGAIVTEQPRFMNDVNLV